MVVEGRDPLQYRRNLETWLANPYALDEKWTERARVEVNEDPETVRSNVEALRILVEGEENLYARTDDLFLLAFLRGRKHNINEAFKVVKSYYRARANYPDFFDLCLPSEQHVIYTLDCINVLEDKDQHDRPVIYFKNEFDISKLSNKQLTQVMIHTLDMLMMDPHVQIAGVSIVTNLTGQTMGFLRHCTPTFLIIISRIFTSTFPLRLRCAVSFNASYVYKKIWALMRPLLKEKIRKRNHILGDDLTEIHEYITPDILPPDAGGKKPYCPEMLQERLTSIESYLRDWSTYGLNKAPRRD